MSWTHIQTEEKLFACNVKCNNHHCVIKKTVINIKVCNKFETLSKIFLSLLKQHDFWRNMMFVCPKLSYMPSYNYVCQNFDPCDIR